MPYGKAEYNEILHLLLAPCVPEEQNSCLIKDHTAFNRGHGVKRCSWTVWQNKAGCVCTALMAGEEKSVEGLDLKLEGQAGHCKW